jgi:hypothetical protein
MTLQCMSALSFLNASRTLRLHTTANSLRNERWMRRIFAEADSWPRADRFETDFPKMSGILARIWGFLFVLFSIEWRSRLLLLVMVTLQN